MSPNWCFYINEASATKYLVHILPIFIRLTNTLDYIKLNLLNIDEYQEEYKQ